MARTIYIGDDIATSKMKVIFSEQDFVNLVYEYMGKDARSYLEEIINQRESLAVEIKDLCAPSRNDLFDDGWHDGHREGYREGYDAGYDSGYEAGKNMQSK